ncbi:GGDEF domain-containing protein [Shewanella sp. C32]|uniref:diguanylate cyclase n=1 Tax=Shewanella electrica TaxID=515560 RepID=A0ABT2FKL9_9GAMM|nr:GGDEF domain-containing protein [Shewanella electrica]MCH1924668.1 GGDEF domain-containing protein [Shewanella electrica]MCS4556884.1 GGDEF domain-containing protein [Shewanella electrica]
MDFLPTAEGYADTYIWQDKPLSAVKIDQLHLLQKLHASLDPRTVFASYGKQLQAVLPLYGVQLHDQELSLQWGRPKGQKLSRILSMEHGPCQLDYYVSVSLNPSESHMLDQVEPLLIQPLSNAKKHQKIAEQVLLDSLTNLGNRLWFNQALAHSIARHRRGRSALSLLILDLDNFKKLNDSKGHREGDRALTLFADIIRSSIRSTDQAFRLGGDEFVIIVEGNDEAARHIADRVLQQGAHQLFFKENQLSCSIGISSPPHKITAEQLFEQADTALYQAKTSGRNRYCIA